MPTSDDLREALRSFETLTPDAVGTRDAVRTRIDGPASRRWSVPVLTAATAVVVAVLAVWLVNGWRSDAPSRPAGPGTTVPTATAAPSPRPLRRLRRPVLTVSRSDGSSA